MESFCSLSPMLRLPSFSWKGPLKVTQSNSLVMNRDSFVLVSFLCILCLLPIP